jgi:hypothetical protein
MSTRRLAKLLMTFGIVMTIVAIPGFIIALVVNAFFLDKYNAYGEVPIPGSGTVHLPKGQVTVNLHVLVVGNNNSLPVPPLSITINPPDGVAHPAMTENIGSTTTVNNDAHIRVWLAQVPAEGDYNVTTDGQVGGFINPRLAFGHKSSLTNVIWLFVGIFVVGLADSIVMGIWLGRTRKKAVSEALIRTPYISAPPESGRPPSVPPPAGYLKPPVLTNQTPDSGARDVSAEGIRLERLKSLAALRDSGALTEQEFQTEKLRILNEF